MALSCKLSLSRFSTELKFQDRAECGNIEAAHCLIILVGEGSTTRSPIFPEYLFRNSNVWRIIYQHYLKIKHKIFMKKFWLPWNFEVLKFDTGLETFAPEMPELGKPISHENSNHHFFGIFLLIRQQFLTQNKFKATFWCMGSYIYRPERNYLSFNEACSFVEIYSKSKIWKLCVRNLSNFKSKFGFSGAISD